MGFGLLFIGYFMAAFMSMSPIGGYLIRLVGYAMILFGALKLKRYNKDFRYLCMGALLMSAISFVIALSAIFDNITTVTLFSENVKNVIGHLERIGYVLFTFSMCLPIRSIAKETEVEKIAVASVRNFIFTAIYFILYLVAYIPLPFTNEYKAYFGTPVFVLYIVIIFMNLFMLFSCYAKICDESDVEMAQKPSRFAFVNRFREENERRRAEADARAAQKEREKRERRKNGR
ncbi:MAG: hypothetical protein E7670_08135 [Ruminococcaceae bacterium]|nr:hypothetical protein [Oscillospiraceae bacterium]